MSTRDVQHLADHASFQEVAPAFHGVPAPPRFHFGTFPAELAARYYSHTDLGPSGVWSSDALTVGPGLLLRTPDGAFIKAPQLNWLEHHIETALSRAGELDFGNVTRLNADAVLMLSGGYRIYGHWLADILPRLILLERCGYILESLVFLVPADLGDFARHLLELVGIGADRLHFLTGQVQPRNLLMPTFPHNGRQFMALAGDGFRLLQSRIAARFGRLDEAGTPARILVSRHGYGSRPLLNRAEVEALAKEFGFTPVAPQNLTLIQQVRLFASASAIIGEYGSGLHNAAFSAPGTVVAAIRGTLMHPAFLQSGIGDALQQPTGYIFGTSGDHVNHPDFRINLDAVRDCLRTVFPAGHNFPSFQQTSATEVNPGSGALPPLSAANALQTFREAMAVGNLEEALAAGRLLMEDGNNCDGIAAALATLSAKLGHTTDAITYAIAALEKAPEDAGSRQLLAKLLPPSNDHDPALHRQVDAISINFLNAGNAGPLLGKGWGRHAQKQRWMLQTVSTLNLPPLDAQCDWLIELDAFPFNVPARLRILLGTVQLTRMEFRQAISTPIHARIPAEVLAGIRPHILQFEHPDACTPHSIDGRDDNRQLAFGVRTLLLVPVLVQSRG